MRAKTIFPLLLVIVTLAADPLSAGQSTPSKKDIATLDRLSSALQRLSQQVSKSVVQVLTRGFGPVPGSGEGFLTTQMGAGSGIVVDTEGFIITNAHVVQGAQKVRVVLPEGPGLSPEIAAGSEPRSRMVEAKVLGTDPESDLAVLQIHYRGLPPLEFADSTKLRQGQLVLACGSPLGLENSVSMGVVSSVARQIKPDDPMIYIQTDAPINPGNSGGPLVDIAGRVVGISTFIFTQSGGSEGLGFAIPSNIAQNIYHQLRENGHVHRGEIGVQARTITPVIAAALHLPRDWGVLLEDVQPGSPASKAGLRAGDLVLTLDSRPVENALRFEVAINQHVVGESVILQIVRGEEKITAEVEVIERPNDPYRFMDLVTREDNMIPQLGIFALDLDSRIADQLPSLRKPAAVVVAAKAADTTGPGELFQAGDLIDSLNGEPVVNLSGLREAISKLHSGDPVVVQVQRQGKLLYLAFELQ
jgi:serine protease Do